MTPHEYLLSNGFEYVGYTAPYSFYEKPNNAVGMCVCCGIVITGKCVIEKAGQYSIPALVRHRWRNRSISELESFIKQNQWQIEGKVK